MLGVLGCPNLNGGELLVAIKGQGAQILPLWDSEDTEGTPIKVSEITDTAAACFCESVESGHSDHSQSAQIAKLLEITKDSVRLDSQAKYATIAKGDAQIYLRLPTSETYREKIWDHAAGKLVVEEAGGTVTDVAGNPLNFTHGRKLEQNRGVIATCGPIHNKVVEANVRYSSALADASARRARRSLRVINDQRKGAIGRLSIDDLTNSFWSRWRVRNPIKTKLMPQTIHVASKPTHASKGAIESQMTELATPP